MQSEKQLLLLNPTQHMHKHLLTIVAILCLCNIYSIAQTVENQDEAQQDTVLVGIHPWKEVSPINPERAYWTLYLHGGFNVFDGDFTSEKKHGVYAPTIGIGASYYFNNTWSIGVDYIWRQYKVTGSNKLNTAPTMLKGDAHQIDAYITFDIFNAWRPQNKYKLFALNLILGGGVSWYKNSTYLPNKYHTEPDGVTITLPQRFDYHTLQQTKESHKYYHSKSLFLGGASFDFNITRSLALGVRCVYNYYTKDDVDGRERGNNNDGVFDCTVMLRYKINATKKSHVSNFRSKEVLEKAVLATNPQLRPRQVPDTVVVYHSDTVVMVRTGGATNSVGMVSANAVYDNNYYVYFDPSEYILYDEALKTIQQVADRLKEDDNLCIEVIGYCDNTGSDEFNNTLGENRAESVADEFMQEHGISGERISIEGRGIIRGRRSTAAYSPNRRAVIHLIDRDAFERKHGQKMEKNQAVPEFKRVVVDHNETLSKLARKYYGNTYCWIYIFEANKDRLATPNSVKPGMQLDIPTLTQKQTEISKEEASKRYEKYKLR